MLVTVASNQSPITKQSKKKVKIEVYDKNGTTFLKDDSVFVSASIDANFVWEKFEEIEIELFEVGNKFSEDPYNAHLVKHGPNSLLKLTYTYDKDDKKFKRKLNSEANP
ncbi:MAG: hypothetical protein C4520_10690 [Candidatus Abyssobacteria bacterium SURF_5]|uniref:Uncharacterized protein n=1 Tax=Abyssobacteria bacterium (strain SURF_5) TaxID=2093360 RepID=A0A3A4NJ80_ABYX5|nr:MAG: hypothetical protein C4520_10690 [Candidatus Abyssubacteria bacterium SURF_5]